MSFLKKLMPGHHGKDKHDEHLATGATTTTTTSTSTSGAMPVAVAEVPIGDTHHHHYGPPPSNASATVSHPIGNRDVIDHHHHTTGQLATGVAPVAPSAVASTEQKLVLSEEKLVVGKREQEVGGVDVSKRIERHTESVPVTLNKEVVSIERRPIAAGTAASFAGAGASTFGQEQHITATVTAEQAIVGKTIVPSEQVQVTKARVAENQLVQGAVRTENVEVKRDAVNLEGVRRSSGASASGVATGASTGAARAPVAGGSGNIMDAQGRVTAFEEHLAVGKERVATGHVDVHKRVDTAIATAPVRLEHDEVGINRSAVTGPVAVPSSLSQGSVHIGIGRETAQVGTVVVPKEEIVIRKGMQTEQQMVSGEVLREKIAVSTAGTVHVDPHKTMGSAAQPTTAHTTAAPLHAPSHR